MTSSAPAGRKSMLPHPVFVRRGFTALVALTGLSLLALVWKSPHPQERRWVSLARRRRLVADFNRPNDVVDSLLPAHEWSRKRFGFPSAFKDDLYLHNHRRATTSACEPERLHMTQASNIQPVDHGGMFDMILSFTLPRQCDPNIFQVRVVYELADGDGLPQFSQDYEITSFDYDASLAIPGLKDYHSDWIYHVRLKGLQGGDQTYSYQIFVEKESQQKENALLVEAKERRSLRVEDDLWDHEGRDTLTTSSQKYYFRTPPLPSRPTTLALVGDLGQTENSTKTMHRIYQRTLQGESPVSAVLIAGDLSYADGDPYRWESWLELMEPLLRSTPLFSVPGNHEIECDNDTSEVFGIYEAYFRNPNRLGPAQRQPIPSDYRKTLWSCLTSSEFMGHYDFGSAFWSVQHGMVQIIGLNSYTSSLPGSPQYTWLDRTLKEVDRRVTPWVLVSFHCPLHTTFQGHNGELNPLVMLHTFEPLFIQYKVNLVVSGHDHAYMRTYPMKGTKVDPQGVVYWTLGAGGNREQHNKGYLHPQAEDWVATRTLSDYGFGQLHVANATHAHLEWVRDGTTTKGIHDKIWLENTYFA